MQKFYCVVGAIDVLLDDGGHGNVQQIVTVDAALDHVKDGGMIVVEDVHTSYWRRFGNPSAKSFISFTKRLIDQVNSRSRSIPQPSSGRYRDSVASIEHFESIVAIKVDRRLAIRPEAIDNAGETMNAANFFVHDQPRLERLLAWGERLRDRVGHGSLPGRVMGRVNDRVAWAATRRQSGAVGRRGGPGSDGPAARAMPFGRARCAKARGRDVRPAFRCIRRLACRPNAASARSSREPLSMPSARLRSVRNL